MFGVDLSADTSSTLFWIWAAATLVLATGLGFLAGVSYASRATDRNVRKAAKTLSSLYALVLHSLDNAHRIVALLESFPKVALTVEEVERLDSKRSSLFDSLSRIVGKRRTAAVRPPELILKAPPKPFKMKWQVGGVDSHTQLPDKVAYDENLKSMLEASGRAGQSSGLLVVRIDRMDQLKSRFGIAGADAFVKEVAAVITQAARPQDLACRLTADSFALLIPSVDAESGRKLSQAIRSSVRVNVFRIHEGGPEVMVTASFGFASCPPGDTPERAMRRANDALAQSARHGRNQLYVSDGESLVHCAAV